MPAAPKDYEKNLLWRRKIIELGNSSKGARTEIYRACRADPVLFIDSFLYGFNPRDRPQSPTSPFILYDYQEKAVRRIAESIGHNDLIIPKSRATGGTFCVLAAFFHRWLFYDDQSFLLLSAKEDRVDAPKDASTLFWKLDHFLKFLPPWLTPPTNRVYLRLVNERNGSSFHGESTNQNPDRGGRRTAILADEAAAMPNCESVASSIQHVSNSVIWLSTFAGAFGYYYSLYRLWSEKQPERVIRFHWTSHPLYSKGLSYDADGKPTSPWYRNECSRTPSKRQIAQEIDMDPQASGGMYFEQSLIDELMQMSVMEPTVTGEMEEDPYGDPLWTQTNRGRLVLWFQPDDEGKPAKSQYVIGFDLATGKGGAMSSQSCAAVYDALTGEKVAEYQNNKITPTTFARYAALLGKWFHNAKLIWGSQGPGADFGKTLVEDCQYGHVYFRLEEGKVGKKRSKKFGYPEIGEHRQVMFSTYYDALHQKRVINRSRGAVKELGQFIFSPTGEVEHCEALQKETDPENKGKLHGDIVIADAMANILLRERKTLQKPKQAIRPAVNPLTGHFPKYSPGWRYQQHMKKKRIKEFY